MLLRFSDSLIRINKFDRECVALADRHYSRQKPGTNQFMPPGSTLVIRDHDGLLVFGWLWQQYRDDGQQGYNCSIFRNESPRRSSEVILECERMAFAEWGPARLFTYIDPQKIASPNPGFCFKAAGWKFVQKMPDGKHLLAKEAI